MYSSCDFDYNYADSDEKILVVLTNNWLIGCYSFLLEECSRESLSNDSAIYPMRCPDYSEVAAHSFLPDKPRKCQ